MPAIVKTAKRLEDEQALEALYALEVVGQKAAVALGYSVGRLAGLRKRCLTDPGRDPKLQCECRKAANRDGGMPARWWDQ